MKKDHLSKYTSFEDCHLTKTENKNKTRCQYAAPARCNTNDLSARGTRAKIKRNDAGTLEALALIGALYLLASFIFR